MIQNQFKPKSNFCSLKIRSNKSTNYEVPKIKTAVKYRPKRVAVNFIQKNKKQAFDNNIGRFFAKGSPNKQLSKTSKHIINEAQTLKQKPVERKPVRLNNFVKAEGLKSNKNLSLYERLNVRSVYSSTKVLNKENSRSSNKHLLRQQSYSRSVSKSVKRLKDKTYKSPMVRSRESLIKNLSKNK